MSAAGVRGLRVPRGARPPGDRQPGAAVAALQRGHPLGGHRGATLRGRGQARAAAQKVHQDRCHVSAAGCGARARMLCLRQATSAPTDPFLLPPPQLQAESGPAVLLRRGYGTGQRRRQPPAAHLGGDATSSLSSPPVYAGPPGDLGFQPQS